MKFLKNKRKETSLKAARDKWGWIYSRIIIQMTEDFSLETMGARINDTFLKFWKKKPVNPNFYIKN